MTGKVRINLKNQKLEDHMKDVDKYGSTCLFNGVTHFWSEEITQMKESVANKGHGFGDEDGNVNHDMNLIVAQNEAMSGIVVNDESVDRGEEEDNEEISNTPHKLCTKTLWTHDIAKMQKKN